MTARASGAARAPAGGALAADAIVRQLRSAYAGHAWHGPSVLGTLRGITPAEAAWRPAPGRNSVWALVLHLAYARWQVVRRLVRAGATPPAGDAPRFPRALDRSWWPALPDDARGGGPADRAAADAPARAWRADLALLAGWQSRLMETVERAGPRVLAARRRGKEFTLAEEALGVAMHDAYHAGQIRLIRHAFAARRSPSSPLAS